MKKIKDYEIGLGELIAFVSMIISIVALVLGILALVKTSKVKKRVISAENEYYDIDEKDDYDFTLGEIGEIDDDYFDNDEAIKF